MSDTPFLFSLRRGNEAPWPLHKWLFPWALFTIDAMALLATGGAAPALTILVQKILHVSLYDPMGPGAELHQNIFWVLGASLLFMFADRGLYSRKTPWWEQVRSVLKIAFFLFLVHGFISFSLKIHESRILIMTTWGLATAFLIGGRSLIFLWVRSKDLFKISTVILGETARVADIAYALNSDFCALHKICVLVLHDAEEDNLGQADLPKELRNFEIHGKAFDCESFIRAHPNYFYILSMNPCQGVQYKDLLRTLNETGKSYAIAPGIAGANLYKTNPTHFFGHDVTLLETRPTHPPGISISLPRLLKRGMDIALAAPLLILLLPLFAGVALAQKYEGQNGSIFYGDRRIGKDGRLFRCWKFRSMTPDSDALLYTYLEEHPEAKASWDKYQKLEMKQDPRITTKTARLIRKTSIDELPQLWNILVGEMSLVGPRPILEREVHHFEKNLGDYLSVRPGITGLWQVSGRNDTSFQRRIYWDRWYVHNWSLWGDIVILIKTPLVLLTGKGSR